MQIPAINAALIERATVALQKGGLVALPTETVYGLAADADNEGAMRALFAAKGRPPDHPVIVHIDHFDAIADWASDVPESAIALARAFWPGPLTLVLKRTPRVSNLVTGGQDTVGLRAPSHPWMRAVLQKFGGALAAPSANSFGRISPTTAQHVMDDLGEKPRGRVDLILDGGACPIGIESTIVDLSGPTPSLLRPGAISREALQNVLGSAMFDAAAHAPRASGRLEKHYAPRTPLSVLSIDEIAVELSVAPNARAPRIAVLAPMHVLEACRATVVLAIAAADSSDDYTRLLYTHLHRLDSSGADRLLVARPPSGPEWAAVRDRLRRAEAGAASP